MDSKSSSISPAVHPAVIAAENAELGSPGVRIERCRLSSLDADLVLIGTNHMLPEHAAAVAEMIRAENPDCVMVELDLSRAGADIFGPNVAAVLSDERVAVPPWMPPRDETASNVIKMGLSGYAAAVALDGRRSFSEDVIAKPQRRGDPSSYGSDARAAADAAHEVGAQLILGDRGIFVTLGRAGGQYGLWQSFLASQTAACGWELGFPDAPLRGLDVARFAGCVLRKDWEGAAARLHAMAERSDALAAASGSFVARVRAAHPQYARLVEEERAAWLQLLVHGDAVAERAPLDSPGAAAAAAGRAGLRALADRIAVSTQQLPVDALQRYFASEEASAARALVDSILTTDGQLKPGVAPDAAQLARARRAAAGMIAGSGWGPGVPAAMAAERDAILASSILHMRDRCEVGAVARAAAARAAAAAGADALSQAPLTAAAPHATAFAAQDASAAGVAPEAVADAIAPPPGTIVMLKPQPQSSAAAASVAASSASSASKNTAAADAAAVEPPLFEKRLRLVAVVGSAHVPGVLRFVKAADSLAAAAAAQLDAAGGSSSAESSDDVAVSSFDVASAHDSLVAAGFLSAKTVRQLWALFPGQGLPSSAPTPAAAAVAAANAGYIATRSQLESAWVASSGPVDPAVARRALVRAVAACALDDQIVPTLQLEPGHALANAWVPIGVVAVGCVAPFVRRLPFHARIGASLSLMTFAGLNLAASLALRTYGDRISGALDAIDARLAATSTAGGGGAAAGGSAAGSAAT